MKHILINHPHVISALLELEDVLRGDSGFEIDFVDATCEFEGMLVDRLGHALDKGDIVIAKYRDVSITSSHFTRNNYVVGRNIRALKAYERWNESQETFETFKQYDVNGTCYAWRDASTPLKDEPFSDGEAFKRDYNIPNQFNNLPHTIVFVVTGDDGEVIVDDHGFPVGLPYVWSVGHGGYEQNPPEYDEYDWKRDKKLLQKVGNGE